MVRVDSSGTNYDTIGNYTVAVTDSGWAQIGGSYTVTTSATSLLLYAQMVGATSAIGILSGRCGDHRDRAAAERRDDRELYLQREHGRLVPFRIADADPVELAAGRPEWHYDWPAGVKSDGGLHGPDA